MKLELIRYRMKNGTIVTVTCHSGVFTINHNLQSQQRCNLYDAAKLLAELHNKDDVEVPAKALISVYRTQLGALYD